jgi:hypothetical protein
MEILGKKEFYLISELGDEKLKEHGIQFERYVPMVGFTIAEFGWHDYFNNMFFGSFKNSKLAHFFVWLMGEIQCYLPKNFNTWTGIFHKVIALEKNEKIPKNLNLDSLGYII